jgi:hypothetical protein
MVLDGKDLSGEPGEVVSIGGDLSDCRGQETVRKPE